MKQARIELVILGLVLAMGIAAAGYFVGQTLYNAKVAINTAEAKGLATRRVEADVANWSIGFSLAGGPDADIARLYKLAESQQQRIIDALKANGFKEDEIHPGVIEYDYREYRDEEQKLVDERHILRGDIEVETHNVHKVEPARAAINKLIVEGINIQNDPPLYRFTRLNEIKPEMLKEATRNARIAANEFAANAGVKVGGIRSARQGSFFIRDVGGDGYDDTGKIEKEVRVVTTIEFYLTEK